MKRKRKMIAVCHCLLNCNSKVEGLSVFEGVHESIKEAISKDYGILQLPCSELLIYGMRRWGHVKNQFDNDFFREQCRLMLEPYIRQFKEYINNDYKIEYIFAIDYSPSCGYNKTCVSEHWCGSTKNFTQLPKPKIVNEKGVFIEELIKLLDKNNLNIKIIGIDESSYTSPF